MPIENREELSLYDLLWDHSMDIVNLIMKTNFLTDMNLNTLQAERYTNMTIQDVYYIKAVYDILSTVVNEPWLPEDLKEFFSHIADGYYRFYKEMLIETRLKNTDSIVPSEAVAEYVSSYQRVAQLERNKIYMVIALLPCSRLWPYISEHLNLTEDSPYYAFKKNNAKDGSREKYEKLLEDHRKEICENTALEIFRTQMNCERKFFTSF
ncbi:uncharacterized protein LOC120528671 [Polypterus senegalus]|uniref:uncharacterized protein LOC120528671 n=1 Tax=Polypterus senegalus TaxID=55291 RepID=UPI001964495C|nr:uncharacterized protein LOC120528671 [Polypterus senegalus]